MMIARTATAAPAADPQKSARGGKTEAKGASAFGDLMSQFTPAEKTGATPPAGKPAAEKPVAEKPEAAAPEASTDAPAAPGAEAAPVASAPPVPASPAPASPALAIGQMPPVLLAGVATMQPAPAAPAAPSPETPALAAAVSLATPRAPTPRGPKSLPLADGATDPAMPKAAKTEMPAGNDAALPLDGTIAPAADQAAPVLSHKAADVAPLPAAALPGDAASAGSALAQQSLETRLDVARDAQWIDRAARDIAQLATGEGRLRFRLDPEQLGSLQIDLSNGTDGLSLRMTAETEAARAILVEAQPKLLAEARAQGVRIAEAHVDLGSPSGGEGRHAPPPTIARAQERPFGGEAVAETTAAPAGERFA